MDKKYIIGIIKIIVVSMIIIVIEILSLNIYERINYKYDIEQKSKVNDRQLEYNLENIIIDYYKNIATLKEEPIKNMFIASSKISMSNLSNIVDEYKLDELEYDLYLDNIYSVSKNNKIFLCEYRLEYDSNILNDGIDNVNDNRENIVYNNEIIVKFIGKNKYKVLYSKFDLGGGRYYEK